MDGALDSSASEVDANDAKADGNMDRIAVELLLKALTLLRVY